MNADLNPVSFAIVKYCPDPVRDEPVNVGLVASVNGRLQLLATPKFSRLRRVTGVSDLHPVQTALTFLRSAIDRSPDLRIEDLANASSGIIRFSAPIGGLADDPVEFLDDQYQIYVNDNAPARSAAMETRSTIRGRLRRAIAARGRSADEFAISKQRVRGRTGRHEFDYGFDNGRRTLVRGISLQTQEGYALTEARALSFAVLDTRDFLEHLHVTAVVAPPDNADANEQEEALALIRSHANRVIMLDHEQADAAIDDVFRGHVAQVRPLPAELLVAA